MSAPRLTSSALRQPLDLMLGTVARVRAVRAVQASLEGLRAVDVARHTGLTIGGAQRALATLVPSGLVQEALAGRRGAVYRWNPKHPFAPPLSALFETERARRDAVVGTVGDWLVAARTRPVALWWFGSSARHTDTFDSDVDLALVGPENRATTHALADALRAALAPAGERFAFRPDVIEYTVDDVRHWPTEDAAMWEHLVRESVVLHGPAPERLRATVSA